MQTLQKFDDWKQHTWQGLLLATVLELLIAYGLGSWALDSGSWWLYLFTVIFLIGGIKNFVNLIKVLIHGQPKKGSARRTTK